MPLDNPAAPLTDPAADAPPGVVDAKEAAAEAGLRYVSDETPGITRRRSGKGFAYRMPDGSPVRDKATLERIRSLAIPPAIFPPPCYCLPSCQALPSRSESVHRACCVRACVCVCA